MATTLDTGLRQTLRRTTQATKVALGRGPTRLLEKHRRTGSGLYARLERHFIGHEGRDCCRQLVAPGNLAPCLPEFVPPTELGAKYAGFVATSGLHHSPPAGVIRGENLDVSFPIGMHAHAGRILEDGLLGTELLTNPKYALDWLTLRVRPKQEIARGALLSMPWHHNFYHWFLEILPRLHLYDLDPSLSSMELLVPESAPAFVRRSLELSGYADRVRFVSSGAFRVRDFALLSRLSTTADVSPHALEWLNRSFKPRGSATVDRLYISRRDAAIRFLANESELEGALEKRGFQTVAMGELPLEDQIDLIRGARVIVAVHGAALAHLAFAQPGTVVLEMFEEGHFNHCFSRIAQLRGLRYGFVIGEKRGMGFAPDVAELTSLLDRSFE